MAQRTRRLNLVSCQGTRICRVTKDRDYLELSRERGHPPKVILIRAGNTPNAVVESLLRDHYDEILAFEQDPARGIIELG